MDELIVNLDTISLETFLGALLVFLLTMIIKFPIKKYTSKFDENKRKAINTVIVAIPLVVSAIVCVVYWGAIKSNWDFSLITTNCISIYLLSLTIYAIFSRILVVIKAAISGKDMSSNEIKQEVNEIKSNISEIVDKVDFNSTSLDEIIKKINELKSLRNSMTIDSNGLSLVSFDDIDNEIARLETMESYLEQNNL